MHTLSRTKRRRHCKVLSYEPETACWPSRLMLLFSAMAEEKTPFQEIAEPMRTGNKYWTILGDRYPNDLEELASEVVLNGQEKAVKGVPLGALLRYFLAPMQDGKFQQGNHAHPIGKAIFVFTGGTSWTLDNLGKNAKDEERRTAKVPDFVPPRALDLSGFSTPGSRCSLC